MNSTPIEKEPVMECPLLLTTLSGVTFKVSLSVAKFDRFTDLEDQVMDYLASVTDLQVFGCVIDFLHTTTQTYLEDPIWDKLQQGREYTIVFRDCSVTLLEQEQLGGYPIDQVPLAVHVPMNSEETVPEWAFAGVPRLRHVSVESGIRLIGAEAWQGGWGPRYLAPKGSVDPRGSHGWWGGLSPFKNVLRSTDLEQMDMVTSHSLSFGWSGKLGEPLRGDSSGVLLESLLRGVRYTSLVVWLDSPPHHRPGK